MLFRSERRLREDPELLMAYERGRARTISDVGLSLVQQAMGGNMRAAEFYLRTQAGWSEVRTIRHEGKVGLYQALDELPPDEAERLADLPDDELREQLRLMSGDATDGP